MLNAGGALAYRARVTINNGTGEMTVFGFDKPIDELVPELKRLFALESVTYSGGTMGFAHASSRELHLRFILLQLGSKVQTLVFKIRQSGDEFERSSEPPQSHLLDEVPGFPASEPSFYMRDESTRTAIAVSSSFASPGEIREFFRSQLSAAGWGPAIPGNDSASDPGLTVYIRGPEICCCLVKPAPDRRRSVITLLHKRQGVK